MNNDNEKLIQGNMRANNGASIDLESQQPANTAQESILKQSSHPVALIFHLLFRSLALFLYIFASIVGDGVFSFVIIILLLSFDFWTVKNVTGRLLVGLRWWNEIKEDGSNLWIFESRTSRKPNTVDSRIFWTTLYIFSVLWVLCALSSLLRFNWNWLAICCIAIALNMANLVGYTKCEKDAKKKMANLMGNNSMVQGFMGNLISWRLFGRG